MLLSYDFKSGLFDISGFFDSTKGINVSMKREDLLGDGISGNKLRKLKYNLLEANKQGVKTFVTFGGAYSNHIAAASCIPQYCEGAKVIGVIRGEELAQAKTLNPTLAKAKSNGMQLHFVSREDYRLKETEAFIDDLRSKFGSFYLLPEGGTNPLAIKGCEEILTEEDKANFDVVCCAVGTGGTVSGIINSTLPSQQVIGFPALKGDFLKNDVAGLVNNNRWAINTDFHFGGYAKINTELIEFINDFKNKTGIALDPIYTGKMMYGIYAMIENGDFKKNTSILAVHTGGLQAIEGMNNRLLKKGLPLITT